MSQKVKQAIAATRAGKTKDAQILLTQVLQDDPDDTQAWYLLSLLVDSPTKKQAYLQKVLALEPSHEKAQQALAQMQVAANIEMTEEETAVFPPPAIPDAEPAFSYEDDEDTLPDWLKNAQPVQVDMSSEMAEDAAAEPNSTEDLPDWLKGNVEESWVESEQPTLISERQPETEMEEDASITLDEMFTVEDKTTASEPTPAESSGKKLTSAKTTPAAQEKSSTALWDRLLWALIAGAIIILLLMVYTLMS